MEDRAALLKKFADVRAATERLCEPLAIEDYVVQPSADVSPPRWHLGHTTWFYETFVLAPYAREYRPYDAQYGYLFNSYYDSIGEHTARPDRGLLTRPTVREVYDYRRAVNQRVQAFVGDCNAETYAALRPALEIGINHEQQHQELLLTDIKFILFQPPLYPRYATADVPRCNPSADRWRRFGGGVVRVGHDGQGFAFDNEGPPHEVLLQPFGLAEALVTNAQYQEFMRDGGYSRPELWLSDGWELAQSQRWKAPLYWIGQDSHFTLYGVREIDPHAPVTHVSYYEADAFAHWAGMRLPTEHEWEHAARELGAREDSSATADRILQPRDSSMIGNAWQWTRGSYHPYPGYRPACGPLGEYNGKFMVNQIVLRGGSVATPRGHMRASYRNFWHPDKRWQFTGIRLAEDGGT